MGLQLKISTDVKRRVTSYRLFDTKAIFDRTVSIFKQSIAYTILKQFSIERSILKQFSIDRTGSIALREEQRCTIDRDIDTQANFGRTINRDINTQTFGVPLREDKRCIVQSACR